MIRIINEVNFDKFDDYDLGPSWESDIYEQFATFVQDNRSEDATYKVVDAKNNCISVKLPMTCGGEDLYSDFLVWDEERVCKDVSNYLSNNKDTFTELLVGMYASSTDPEIAKISTSKSLENTEKYELISDRILNTLGHYSKETHKQITENWRDYYQYLFDRADWNYFDVFDDVDYFWKQLFDSD